MHKSNNLKSTEVKSAWESKSRDALRRGSSGPNLSASQPGGGSGNGGGGGGEDSKMRYQNKYGEIIWLELNAFFQEKDSVEMVT